MGCGGDIIHLVRRNSIWIRCVYDTLIKTSDCRRRLNRIIARTASAIHLVQNVLNEVAVSLGRGSIKFRKECTHSEESQ